MYPPERRERRLSFEETLRPVAVSHYCKLEKPYEGNGEQFGEL